MPSQTYGATQIQKKTGLTKMQVMHLVQTNVIEPKVPAHGRGARRKFSTRNLIEFLVCAELLKYEVPRVKLLSIIRGLSVPGYELKGQRVDAWEVFANRPQKRFLVIVPDPGQAADGYLTNWTYGIVDKREMASFLRDGGATSALMIDVRALIDSVE